MRRAALLLLTLGAAHSASAAPGERSAELARTLARRVTAVERRLERPRREIVKAVAANVARLSEERSPDGRLLRVWIGGDLSVRISEDELGAEMRRTGGDCAALRRAGAPAEFAAGLGEKDCADFLRTLALDRLAASRLPEPRRGRLRYGGVMPAQPGLSDAEGWDLSLEYMRLQGDERGGASGASWAVPAARREDFARRVREILRGRGEAVWRRAMEKMGPEDVWIVPAALEAALDELLPVEIADSGPRFLPRSGAPLPCPPWTADAVRASRGPWRELKRLLEPATARDLAPLSPQAQESFVERAVALAAAQAEAGTAGLEDGLKASPEPRKLAVLFREIPAAESGLIMPPREAPRDDHNTDQMPGGLAVLDYDGDGRPDLFLCDFEQSRLFRNLGGMRFKDVTAEAGLAGASCRNGASSADYDNDGRPDLLLLHDKGGRDRLWRNEGGRFRDVSTEVGLSTAPAQTTSAVWLDYDGDGRLDLFLLEYGDLAFSDREPSPGDAKNAWPHRLYRNAGGRFVDVSTSAGVADTGWGLAAAAFDADGDGRTDLLVSNDFGRPLLYRNRGDGTFEDATSSSGLAAYGNGMGVSVADYDGDGKSDVFLTYIGDARPKTRPLFPGARPPVRTEPTDVNPQRNRLYRGRGDGTFEERSSEIEDVPTGWGWNGMFLDASNSGAQDLFLVNGWWPHRHFYDQDAKAFWRWDPALKRFRDMSEASGLDFAGNSRASAYDDFDGDGCLDLVVTGFHAPRLFAGNCPKENHWLELRLAGSRSDRDGIGARATVRAGGRAWTAELGPQGGGFQNSLRRVLRFGLGPAMRYDSIEVAWPSGARQSAGPGDADRALVLREEDGRR